MKIYTEEQKKWLRNNASVKVWESQKEFTDSFNRTFNENKSVDALSTYLQKHDIDFLSKGRLTAEQTKWIKENCRIIEWKNTKHFTDTFNAIFGTNKNANAMNNYLYKNGLQIRSGKTTDHYTDEMNSWLIDNFGHYDYDFVELSKDFNKRFGTDYSNCRLAKHCQRGLKIHSPKKKEPHKKANGSESAYVFRNKGQFATGITNGKGLPIGTIRYNSDGRPFIKVLDNDGKSGQMSGYKGHNYKEPWWKPLQKKIWEDYYGEVPKGYVVISLNGNPNDTDIKNIGIIDKRGTAVMAKKGWWTTNSVITGDGAQWCNLYYVAKDNEIRMES